MTKTNEKTTIKMDHFGKYGETKTVNVWINEITGRKMVKIRKDFYFFDENGQLWP